MRIKILIAPLLLTLCCGTAALWADAPEQEQEFTIKYQAAYEARATATLYSFPYTDGANPIRARVSSRRKTGDSSCGIL